MAGTCTLSSGISPMSTTSSTSTMVVLAALHIGRLKLRVVFLTWGIAVRFNCVTRHFNLHKKHYKTENEELQTDSFYENLWVTFQPLIPKEKVARPVGLPRLDECKVPSNGLLHDVVPSIEYPALPWGTLDLNSTTFPISATNKRNDHKNNS